MSSFALRLKELREEKELTQAELGEKLGISRNTIASWESNRRTPELETAKQLADFFNVSVDYLLGRTNIRKFDLDIDNIAAMRSREMEGYNDLTKEEQEFLRNFVREYYERFGKKKESE